MCTVTIVPHEGGVRLVCNRDERRTRPPALPPRLIRAGQRRAILPIDPAGGGTWIAANDAGLVLTLLNRHEGRYAPGSAATEDRSRGLIVRALIECATLESVRDALDALGTSRFAPFRLVAVQNARAAVITSAGCETSCEVRPLTDPLFFTSSSLGDRIVEAPRRELFERLVVNETESRLRGQARFHRHRWPGREPISILMSRADAVTVSRTVVDVDTRGCALAYRSLAPAIPGVVRACCSFH
jgi:hypothetical protein